MIVFFKSSDVDSISECLNGEKLLKVYRDEAGKVLLVFESAYPHASDLLTIEPGGEVVGTFACYDGPDPQQ